MKLQCWDSIQVVKQPLNEISAQLDTIINDGPFQSCSEGKKECQHKNNNMEKSTTHTLYYDKKETITTEEPAPLNQPSSCKKGNLQ